LNEILVFLILISIMFHGGD